MSNRWKIPIAILLMILMCLGAVSASAETTMHREVDDPAIEMTAEIGYQGMITYGKAIPLRVRIRNNGVSDLEGTLGINAYLNNRQYNRYEMEISVPSGAEKEYVLPFSVMTRQEIFTPEIVVDGKVAEGVNIRPGTTIDPNTILVGVLSTKPKKLSNLTINRENDTDYLSEYWQTVPLDPDTFPEQDSLLDSFGILVIDDIDPASLSKKQQEALDRWLEGRHVLLCGSSGGNIAYFSGRTGLEVTGAVTTRQVLSQLETLAGLYPSGNRPEIAISQLTGAAALTSDGDGNGLIFRTETGSGRIYTTAFEMGQSGLNAEKSMHYFWRRVLTSFDNNLYYSLFYSTSYGSPTVYPGSETPVPVRSSLLAISLICAGVLVLGCVLWFILKKKGKQTWMWLVLPVLAAAAAAVILLISGSSGLNQPMVTYTDNVMQRADGSTTRYIGVSAAASAAGMHSYRMDGAPITMKYSHDIDYSYYDEDQKLSEPVEMVMRYTSGDGERLSILTDTPWQLTTLQSESPMTGTGRVEAEIWMEEDGLHGEIVNGTALDMQPGKVITSYGFVSVPALRAGESAAFFLREDKTIPKADYVLTDGVMNRNGGYSLYNVAVASLGLTEDEWNVTGPVATQRDIIMAALDQMTGGNYYMSDQPAFLYSAAVEKSLPLTFHVDGKQAGNVSGMTAYNVEMTFLPVGKTGVIYRMPGMDPAVRMTVDENNKPDQVAESGPKDDYSSKYHSLSENPVFRFTLPGPQEMQITMLRVVLPYYEDQARCCLLNVSTGEWEEVSLKNNVEHPEKYLDENGQMFCRFEPKGVYEYAIDIPTPTLSVEGRALHAEN